MKRPMLLALAVVAMLLPAPGIGQDKPAEGMEALRAAVHADKRGYVASSLALSDAEAKRFWPIYETYQRQLELANRRRSVALVEVAGSAGLSDAHARNVAQELIAADEAELRARRKLRDGVARALPPKKAIRYLQLESKIRAAQNYDLAAAIPLIAP